MQTQVTEDSNAQVVPEGMNQGGGVPQGMPANATSDAGETLAQYEERMARLQQDMNKMRSTYDRNLAERERQWKAQQAELEAKLHEAATRGLDEADKVAYERDLFAQKAQQLEQRLAQEEARRQAEENMRQYSQAYQETFGVDPSKIDTSSQEAFAQSAWQAAAEQFAAMRAKLEEYEAGKQPPPNTAVTRPATNRTVVTNQGGVPSTKPTFNDYRADVAHAMGVPVDHVTDNDVFEAFEKGRIRLDGLV